MWRHLIFSNCARFGFAVLAAALTPFGSLAFGQRPVEAQSRNLPSAQTLEREMTGAETHRYKFNLRVNEFFQVRVEQKGVDVTLKLLGATGNVLGTMDSPNGKQGPETLSFVADKSGDFVLEVSGQDARAEKANYSIRREPSRAATPKDKRRVEVERFFVTGLTARSVKGQTEIALKQLTAAKAGWEELADSYMAQLTAKQIDQVQIPSEISAIVQETDTALKAANAALEEGQRLAVKSKADSLVARAKLNEALGMFRALCSRLIDPVFVEKIRKSGPTSEKVLNYLMALRFFARSGEGLTLAAIAQTHSNLGEWQENIDYLKLSVGVYQNSAKSLSASNITGMDQKQNLRTLKSLEAGLLANIASTLKHAPWTTGRGSQVFQRGTGEFSLSVSAEPRPEIQTSTSDDSHELGTGLCGRVTRPNDGH